MQIPHEPSEFNKNNSMDFEIVRVHAIFLHEAITTIADLPQMRTADGENHTFHFPVLPLSTPYAIPEALGLSHVDVDEIEISIGDAFEETDGVPSRPAYVSVDIHSNAGWYKLSRSGIDGTQDLDITKLEISENTGKLEPGHDPIKHFVIGGGVSVAELNALIMSIALPNELGDYSAYADLELQKPEAFSSLVDLLKERSISDRATYDFKLSMTIGNLHFETENSQMMSFTLNYFDEKRKAPMTIEYDVEEDFRLRFVITEDETRSVVIPTAHEINYARGILRRELINGQPRALTVEQAEHLIDDQSDHLISNEISGLIDDALNELGLNPPNPSA